MEQALNIITRWTDEEELNIRLFNQKARLIRLRPLRLRGEEIRSWVKVKYLGVILDPRLTCNHQPQSIEKEAQVALMVVHNGVEPVIICMPGSIPIHARKFSKLQGIG